MFIFGGLTFLIMAEGIIIPKIIMDYRNPGPPPVRIPTAIWRTVNVSCCGAMQCLEHHKGIQFEYREVL